MSRAIDAEPLIFADRPSSFAKICSAERWPQINADARRLVLLIPEIICAFLRKSAAR
jgi:hypothetical protein